MESDSPIYDTVERLWRQQGREVPRQPDPRDRTPVERTDLFGPGMTSKPGIARAGNGAIAPWTP